MAMVIEKKRFRILLLRGLLGGAVGGFFLAAWSVLGQLELFQRNWDQWLAIIYFVYALPYGLSSGGITAMTIWLIHRQTEADLGPVTRAIIGTVIGFAVIMIVSLIANKMNSESSFRLFNLLRLVLFGFCVGGLPGVFVGRQTYRGLPKRSLRREE